MLFQREKPIKAAKIHNAEQIETKSSRKKNPLQKKEENSTRRRIGNKANNSKSACFVVFEKCESLF